MIRRSIDGAIYLVGLGVVLYVFFCVPVGARTLFEHSRRIAATPEAQELGVEVEHATDAAKAQLGAELRARILGPDAGL